MIKIFIMLNKFLLEHMKENNLYFRGGDLSKNIRSPAIE